MPKSEDLSRSLEIKPIIYIAYIEIILYIELEGVLFSILCYMSSFTSQLLAIESVKENIQTNTNGEDILTTATGERIHMFCLTVMHSVD